VFVCLCVSVFVRNLYVCPRAHLRNYLSNLRQIFLRVTYGRGLVVDTVAASVVIALSCAG